MTRAAVVTLALAAALAGCGDGSEREAAETVAGYVNDLQTADFERLCSRLAPDAREDAVEFVTRDAPVPVEECPDAFGALQQVGSLDFARAGVMDIDQAQHGSAKIDADDVNVDGSSATVDGSSKRVPLERTDSGWRIARLDFGDVPH